MKSIFCFTIGMIFIYNSFSQTYRAAFDVTDYSSNYNSGQGNSFYCNASLDGKGGNVALDGAADIMRSYLIMYHATRDIKYLDKFIIQAKRVQERRDDNIQNIYLNTPSAIENHSLCSPYPNNTPVPDNTNSYGTISKGWSYDLEFNSSVEKPVYCYGWDPTPLYMGKIMFPMAEFIYMIKVEFASDLQNLSLPDEANGINQYKNQYGANYDISENFTSISTYADYANWLEKRLKGTFDFLESDYWEPATNAICGSTSLGTYCQIVPHCTPSEGTDINQQCAMGKALAYMYLAADNSDSYKPLYQDHIIEIAKGLWCVLNTPNISVNNPHYYFYQASEGFWAWEEQFDNWTGNFETTDHGTEDAEFLELCYRYNITDFSDNPLFTESTMKKMGNTLADIIYKQPLDFDTCVSGTRGGPDNWTAAYWGFLIPYNPYIYQELSDVAAVDCIYNNEPGPLQTAYLALAQSPYAYSNYYSFYSNANALQASNYKFNPIALRQGHSLGSDVYCLASGDFDNNGMEDFVSVDDANGVFYSYTPDICDNPNIFSPHNDYPSNCWVVAQSNPHGAVIWKGITAGDFDLSVAPNDHPGDEIIALHPNGTIYLLKQVGGTPWGGTFNEETLTSSYSWAGVTSADFKPANPGDEAVGITSDGQLYFITYNSSGLQLSSLITSTGINQVIGITAGKFDITDNRPQIAILDGSNEYITIFSYDNNSNTFAQIHQYTGAGADNSWNSITSGDFDGDGQDEIAVHRDADGQVLIFKVKSGTITPVYGEYFPIDQSIRAMTIGKFKLNTSGKDALIVFRNFDGQITIFNMDGVCPDAYVNNTTVNNDYTIPNIYTNTNNNYTVDYHANNTLYATNFTVASGSSAEFVAGNKIIVTPGTTGSTAYSGSSFHAYIDATNYGCDSHSTFKTASPTKQPHYEKSITAVMKKDTTTYTGLTISPNPNNGNMNVSYEIKKKETGKLEIYNSIGDILYSYPLYAGKNKFAINGDNLNNGIYFCRATAGNKMIAKDKIVVIK